MKGCVTMTPPTTPGALCTKCGRRTQSATHLATRIPEEQRSWCGSCRSNRKSGAKRTKYGCTVDPTTPGALCTKCRKKPQARMRSDLVPTQIERRSWCSTCRGYETYNDKRVASRLAQPTRSKRQKRCKCGRTLRTKYRVCSPCRRAA